ncbi:cysteine hydrolase family protein [Thermoplasma sp.]|uniref:cysteine hydrolase family protein n=1 Tax=Thermoplasma sp. TaxID=1973142 RepID=UPI00126B360C|nr:cysteine hydrolase family protein [Thermoplasma sp.]KAA8922162.1 MAG: cysteine hydrolase [Thermoplasma sp.]
MEDKIIYTDSQSALIIIDVQKAWDDPALGHRNNTDAEEKIASLINQFREHDLRIVHVRHFSYDVTSPFRPGLKTFEFKDQALPTDGEMIITKRVNSAFIGTDLDVVLRRSGISRLFIVGLTTDHCVSTTARMAGNMGYETYLIEDGCATFDRIDPNGNAIPAEVVHRVNLASIDGEFAKVIESSDLRYA